MFDIRSLFYASCFSAYFKAQGKGEIPGFTTWNSSEMLQEIEESFC